MVCHHYVMCMTTVLLVRHGRTEANEKGILAGTAPGIKLDSRGVEQAVALAEQLSGLEVSALISSPLERTMPTAQSLAPTLVGPPGGPLEVSTQLALPAFDDGSWTGRSLSEPVQAY